MRKPPRRLDFRTDNNTAMTYYTCVRFVSDTLVQIEPEQAFR